MENIAKTLLPQKLCFADSRVDFWYVSEALGIVFMTFTALEAGLKIECFFKVNLRFLNGSRK